MQNKKQAFTLVELIVVITILAILGTIAFISLQGYSASSRDSVRISDVSNMKTSLELFHLNAGKYPLPDNQEIVSYNGEDLWYQGTFGANVVSQLSRNINEIPTDSLSDKEYVYSVANNKNEFEILNLLEGDLALNTISQTNAAGTSIRNPRIDGQYNGVFIKTAKDIVPTPSIITSEDITGGLTLDATNIKSQIITGGKNVPNILNINSATGKLNIILSVYNGTINKDSLPSEKEAVIQKIQAAYTGSELASSDIYAYILSKTSTDDLVALLDTVVLNSSSTVQLTPIIPIDKIYDISLNNESDWEQEDNISGVDFVGGVLMLKNIGNKLTYNTFNDSNIMNTNKEWRIAFDGYTALTNFGTIRTTPRYSVPEGFNFVGADMTWESGNIWFTGGGTKTATRNSTNVNNHKPIKTSTNLPRGKIYFELDHGGSGYDITGLVSSTYIPILVGNDRLHNSPDAWSCGHSTYFYHDGFNFTYPTTPATTNTGIAMDMVTGDIWFRRNGIWMKNQLGQQPLITTSSYSTGGKYIATTYNNSLSILITSKINSVTITNSQPIGTSIKSLVSFDGRTTWKKWNGTSWVLHTGGLDNLQTGNTIEEIEAGLTNFTKATETSLDFAFDLSTTDSTQTPEISGINISYTE